MSPIEEYNDFRDSLAKNVFYELINKYDSLSSERLACKTYDLVNAFCKERVKNSVTKEGNNAPS